MEKTSLSNFLFFLQKSFKICLLIFRIFSSFLYAYVLEIIFKILKMGLNNLRDKIQNSRPGMYSILHQLQKYY